MENLSSLLSELTAPDLYEFTPLQHADSIRLLTLHAGEFSEPIRISICEIRSGDGPKYEALSYTWATEDGDSKRSSSVACDDKCIKATKNCEAALQRLRRQDSPRVLWVDALCIDQGNPEERGHQVELMGDIYDKATEVLVWLGEASERIDKETGLSISEIALRHFGLMAAEMREVERQGGQRASAPLYQSLCRDAGVWQATGKKTSLIRGVLNIMQRPWWKRIWVVQEAGLAKSAIVLCSAQSAKYSDIFLFYKVVKRDNSFAGTAINSGLSTSFKHLGAMDTIKKKTTSKNSSVAAIARLLRRARFLEASDPRDKIFGILGLSSAFAILMPPPDYNATVSDVFCAAARVLISNSRSLLILLEANDESPLIKHPSWVPDWSIPAIVRLDYLRSLRYNAANSSEARFEISSNNKELGIAGKVIDSVDKVAITHRSAYKSHSASWRRIEAWRESCSLGLSMAEYPTGEPVEEALWRTLCWNGDETSQYPAPMKTGDLFEEWHRILSAGEDPKRTVKKLQTKTNRFYELVRFPRTTVCTTEKGFMASVPCMTQVGDRIVVLSGSPVPFMLRTVEGHYKLIGPCYVHGGGIMDGLAFPENLDELEWFSIW